MRNIVSTMAVGLAAIAATGGPSRARAQTAPATGPYHVARTVKVGGEGGFDYVYADTDARRLYVARSGPTPRVNVFNLDTLASVGEIPGVGAHGAVSDASTHHAFASSSPVAMWDSKTLTLIKTIPVEGRPDGLLGDSFNHRVYIFSHQAPNVTVLDAKDGTVVGTVDLGGAPEQAVTDDKGHIYVDIEDKDSVAVIDAKTLKVTAQFSLGGKGGGNAGLALDAKNHVLFVACRDPQTMVMLNADTGKFLADLPIGRGCDGAGFNTATSECFSSAGDGTLTVIKETSPTSFVLEQTVTTMPGAKTMTIDSKTGKVYLIAAEYVAAPAPAAGVTQPAPPQGGRRGGRRPVVPGSFSIVEVSK